MAEKRGNGEGSIYKRKADGLWVGAVTLPPDIDGKQKRKVVTSKDRAVVVKKLRAIKAELAEHGDLIAHSVTLADWLTKWRDEIAPKEVRPKTMVGYRTVINSYIIPTIGKIKLDKLGSADIRKLHAEMARTPKNKKDRERLKGVSRSEWPADLPMLSSTYIRLAHNVLSSALEQAMSEDPPLVRRNVCAVVNKPGVRKLEQPALELEEAIQLLAYCGTIPDGTLWATYLLTGGRRGEVLGLEVDRAQDTIDFSWQLQRIQDISHVPDDWEYRHVRSTIYLTRPKSEAGARIFPNVEPLRSFLALATAGRISGFVFEKDGTCLDPDMPSKRWKEVLRGAGLPDDVNLHGSRHTMADLLYYAGVPEDLIPMILGHSSRAMSRRYKTQSKVHAERLRKALESTSALLTPKSLAAVAE